MPALHEQCQRIPFGCSAFSHVAKTPLGVYYGFETGTRLYPYRRMKKKETKTKSTTQSEVLTPPLTQAEFEKFLRTVTRSIEKSRPEKEKPRT